MGSRDVDWILGMPSTVEVLLARVSKGVRWPDDACAFHVHDMEDRTILAIEMSCERAGATRQRLLPSLPKEGLLLPPVYLPRQVQTPPPSPPDQASIYLIASTGCLLV